MHLVKSSTRVYPYSLQNNKNMDNKSQKTRNKHSGEEASGLPSAMNDHTTPLEHYRSPCISQTEPQFYSGGLKLCHHHSHLLCHLDHCPQQH